MAERHMADPPRRPFRSFNRCSISCPSSWTSSIPTTTSFLGRVIFTKYTVQVDGKEQTQWKLENPVIHNDNGKIVLKITS